MGPKKIDKTSDKNLDKKMPRSSKNYFGRPRSVQVSDEKLKMTIW
jgi:hypothetical protein